MLLRENGKKQKKTPKASTKLTFTQCWVISLLSKKLHCNIAKKNIYKVLKDFFRSLQFILACSGLVRTRFNVLANQSNLTSAT